MRLARASGPVYVPAGYDTDGLPGLPDNFSDAPAGGE